MNVKKINIVQIQRARGLLTKYFHGFGEADFETDDGDMVAKETLNIGSNPIYYDGDFLEHPGDDKINLFSISVVYDKGERIILSEGA